MTSECSEQQKRIARFFLGDLTAAEQQSLEDHLSTCSICRAEQGRYAEVLNLLPSITDEPVPRHFFVNPQERESNIWQIFRHMKSRWQFLTAAAAGLLLLIGIAGVSGLQILSAPEGWSVSFGKGNIDVVALREDILRTAEQRNREADAELIREIRAEIARSSAELNQEQQAYVTAALNRLDSRLKERMTQSENSLKTDTQKLATNIYQMVMQQRVQDLDLINTRIETIEAVEAIKSQETNSILDTLLQVAELRLR